MSTARIGGISRLSRGVPAVAMVLLASAAALAGGAGRAAALAPGQAPEQSAAPAGTISTLAGGPGGPARAASVALQAAYSNAYQDVYDMQLCGVTSAGGDLYLGDDSVVRQVSERTGRLTTAVGNGSFLGLSARGVPSTGFPGPGNTCQVPVDHSRNVLFDFDSGVWAAAARTGHFYGKAMTAGHAYPVAGNGGYGFSQRSGVPATSVPMVPPAGITPDSAGNLAITNNGYVPGESARQRAADAAGPASYPKGTVGALLRVVAASDGTFYGQAMKTGDIYTVAGFKHGFGYGGDGGPGTKAGLGLRAPGVLTDRAGNLVLLDDNATLIRVVAASTGTFYGQAMKAGYIYAVAGDGTQGTSGSGVPGTKAELSNTAVTVDQQGNLVISGFSNNVVRVVAAHKGTFYGRAMKAGYIYTVAGDGKKGYAGDGGPATGARLDSADGTAVDGAGNLLINDSGNNRVRLVAARTGTFYGQPVQAGNIYTIAGDGTRGYTGDGGAATAADVNVASVGLDSAGNLLIGDYNVLGGNVNDQVVRVVAAASGTFYGQAMKTGHIYTVAGNGKSFSGNGGPATAAMLGGLTGITVDQHGNMVIADNYGGLFSAAPRNIQVAAAATGTFYGQAMKAGHIYTVAGGGTKGRGDGGPATSAELGGILGIRMDHHGNLVLSDQQFARVRVVAASTGTFYGQPMKAGHIYTVAGDGKFYYTGDGGPATQTGVDPLDVAVDAAGNLVIDASGNLGSDLIRVVAASTGTFYGQPMTAGHIYTVAGGGTHGLGDGGPATSAELAAPEGVTVDGAGNLVIADTQNYRVRVVAASTGTFYGQPMKAEHIYTVAGDGTEGVSGDGGPATGAELDYPSSVAVDAAGNLVINNRVVAARPGTFYGVAMTAGDIYTVAGGGPGGGSDGLGDGGPATRAVLSDGDVVVDSAGDLLIADPTNDRVRMVTGGPAAGARGYSTGR
jgi:hypothetical protein